MATQQESVSGAATLPIEKPGSRLLYLDNFRIFLTISVILHHACLAYGGSGDWFYMEGATDPISPYLLPLFNAVNQSYFMSAFFLLAGYFTPRSFDKNGAGSFLLGRLIRLGIPLVVFAIFILNLNGWILSRFLYDVPFHWQFAYQPGHLWFIQTLLVFAVAYVLLRLLTRSSAPMSPKRFPGTPVMILCMVILGVLTFLARIQFPVGRWVLRVQPAHFVHYIFSFIMGVLAYRGDWLGNLNRSRMRRWGWFALAMIPGLYGLFVLGGIMENEANIVLFMGGFHWQSFGYALWESVMVIAMNIFLISLFREKHNRSGGVAKTMAAGCFTVYILHVSFLLAFQLLFRGIAIPSFVKFLLVGALTTALCFLLSVAIRKIPGAKRVLG